MPSLKKWLKRNINQVSVSGILPAQKSRDINAMNQSCEPGGFGMGDFFRSSVIADVMRPDHLLGNVMLFGPLIRTFWNCLFFLVVNLCATCPQEIESELSMQQLDVLDELRGKGIIEKIDGFWVATLNDGNELHIPQWDGTFRVKKQPKWSGTLQQIRQLADLPIHTVRIMRESFTDAELNAITELKGTMKRVLHLEHSDVAPDSPIGIGNIADLVELFVQSPTLSHEFIEGISTLQNLRILGFSNCDLDANDLRKLHRLPMLESLNIGWTQLNEDALSELSKFDTLQQLNLNNIDLSGIPAPDLRELKSLDSVSLTQVTISDEWVALSASCAV